MVEKVAAAFPSVARGCLLRKMRAMDIDECLVAWVDSFIRDRRVIMSVDGQDDEPMDVTTGLPQGSPISPVLFAIYILFAKKRKHRRCDRTIRVGGQSVRFAPAATR